MLSLNGRILPEMPLNNALFTMHLWANGLFFFSCLSHSITEPYDYPSWCLILVFSVHASGAAIFIFEWLSPSGLDRGDKPLRGKPKLVKKKTKETILFGKIILTEKISLFVMMLVFIPSSSIWFLFSYYVDTILHTREFPKLGSPKKNFNFQFFWGSILFVIHVIAVKCNFYWELPEICPFLKVYPSHQLLYILCFSF